MNILKWFKPKPKETQPKKFTFNVLEAVKIGDKYTYTVEANNEKEALIKLVKYFFGEEFDEKIESQHYNVTYPNVSTFYTNMPYWFAKKISGYVKEGKHDYQKELEKFAFENNIKLKT